MIALQSTNSEDIIRIGRNFFSAAYISVNYDVDEFTIWAANATEEQDLVAVDSTGAEVNSSCVTDNSMATVTAGGASPSNTGGTNAAKDSGSSSATSGSSVPGIVGGIVGGLAGLAALSVLAWWLMRRRKAAVSTQGPGNPASELEADHIESGFNYGVMGGSTKVEVSGSQLDSQALHELPSIGYKDSPGYTGSTSNTVIHEMES